MKNTPIVQASEIGLLDDQLKKLKELVVAHKAGVCDSVFVFGSRALGMHRPYSDVDLLLENWSCLSASKLADALEESDLPYKFDLVRSELLSEAYAAEVHREKRLLVK